MQIEVEVDSEIKVEDEVECGLEFRYYGANFDYELAIRRMIVFISYFSN